MCEWKGIWESRNQAYACLKLSADAVTKEGLEIMTQSYTEIEESGLNWLRSEAWTRPESIEESSVMPKQ